MADNGASNESAAPKVTKAEDGQTKIGDQKINLTSEGSSGGMEDLMDMLDVDWKGKGGNAGICWECWKLEPCCGEPCNFMDGLRCVLCFWCCGPCSAGKLFAYTVEQECAVVNHCLYVCFCGCFASICLRHNLRLIHGVGDPENWLGDIILAWVCGACAFCQELRSVDPSTWDWLTEFNEKGMKLSVEEFKFVRG